MFNINTKIYNLSITNRIFLLMNKVNMNLKVLYFIKFLSDK